MVSIRDSASRDPSSNLGRTQIFLLFVFPSFFPSTITIFSLLQCVLLFLDTFLSFYFFCRCRGLPNPKYYCSRECQGEFFHY